MEGATRDRRVTAKFDLLFVEEDLPRARNPVLYICHEAEGIQIDQRRDDGYIDATAMCRAYGKLFADYSRLQDTKEFLVVLAADLNMGIPIIRSEPGRYGNTWVHPEVAVDLAKWLSPKFRIMVNRWILAWMQDRQPAIHKDEVEPFVIGRLVKETHAMVSRIAESAPRIERVGLETLCTVVQVAHPGSRRAQQLQLALVGGQGHEPRFSQIENDIARLKISLEELETGRSAPPDVPVPGDPSTWRPIRRTR
jgi:hypothetical protein